MEALYVTDAGANFNFFQIFKVAPQGPGVSKTKDRFTQTAKGESLMPKFILAVVIVLALMFIAAEGGEKTTKKPEKSPKKGLTELKLELPPPGQIGTLKPIKGMPHLRASRAKGKKRPAFYVPEGVKNLASGKKVTSSDDLPIIGEPKMLTDGDKNGKGLSLVEFAPGKQWVQIDLGKKTNIYAIVIWRNHWNCVAYKDVIVRVADDADMIINCKTVFNNDHDNSSKLGIGKDMAFQETHEGEIVNAKGIKGRFVRIYSNGNTENDMNYYSEVEVYGKQ